MIIWATGGEENERRERASRKGRIKELLSRLVMQTPPSLATVTLTRSLFKRIKQLNKPVVDGYKERPHLHKPRNPAQRGKELGAERMRGY